MKIDVEKDYSLQEIADKELIKGVRTYGTAYNLVTQFVTIENETRRVLNAETTKSRLAATHDGKPWKKIAGKITVQGSEIKQFLELNNIY